MAERTTEYWPNRSIATTTDPPEKRKIETFHCMMTEESIIERYSSYPRALRVTAFVLRFIDRCKTARDSKPSKKQLDRKIIKNLSHQEIVNAKRHFIRLVQRHYYPDEYQSLLNKKPISRKSSILTLNPFLDSHQIVRVNGRALNSKH